MITKKILENEGRSFLVPFILITACFAMWGFSNDITAPLVKSFSKIFRMSVTEGSLINVATYLGYFVMAFPAAMFIQRYTFKAGVLLGLTLFAVGVFLFLPARALGHYYPFLLAYFILTCGLSFLETSCNPYVYCMGPEESATLRLNLAQAFNPLGAMFGMWVAMEFIQGRMNPMSTEQRAGLSELQFNALKDHDLGVLIGPYLGLGVFCLILLAFIRLQKMPRAAQARAPKGLRTAMRELLHIANYREGLIAQFFYEGAQICCWTYIIQYGTRIFMAEGMDEKTAEIEAMQYNIYAMLAFAASRFVCTWLLKYIPAGRLLSMLAILALSFLAGVILFPDRNGMYCLVAVSGCMSLMFPTIYGIALRGVGENVKYAGAGLVMAILGASLVPPLQALVIDADISLFGLSATNLSFVVPLLCFLVVALYGHRAYVRHYIMAVGG